MSTASDTTRNAVLWLKRLWPLLLLLAATAFALAMGWQHYLTLQALAENRETLRGYIDGNMLVSLLHLYGIDTWPTPTGKGMTDKLGSSTGHLEPLEMV